MKTFVFAACAVALAPAALAQDLAFVACPIVRDTKTVPCWITEYDGETYYLGIQSDVSAEFNPPSLGHYALIEGSVSDKPRICGGLVLEKVVVSIIPERADNCRTKLMSEDRYQLPFEPPRPPGPSMGRLAYTYAPPPPLPAPPFSAKNFVVPYDFDTMVGFKHPRFLEPIMAYALHVKAKRVVITGYRAAVKLSNGETLTEHDDIAQRRAQEVAALLRGAGMTQPKYDVKWVSEPEVGDASRRRVTVDVIP